MGLPKLWGNAPDGSGHGFIYSHVKSIYYNWAQKKLLSTKLDEMDTTANNIQDHQIAYIFTEEYPYVTGEYTIYNERLYRFIADKEAGAWDSSKVQETVVGNDLYDKFDTSKIIASTNITQNGYVMDGKTCSDAIAQLNDDIDPTYAANRVLISNGSGKATASDITSSELACLDGATENIPNRLSTMQSALTSNNNRLSNVIGGIIPDSGVLIDWAKDDASRRIIWKVIGNDGFTGSPDDSSEWCIINYNANTSPNRGIVVAYELRNPYRIQYRYYYNSNWIFAWQSIK